MYKHKLIGRAFLFGAAICVWVMGCTSAGVDRADGDKILKVSVGKPSKLNSKVPQPLISDYFQDSQMANWTRSSGTWHVDNSRIDFLDIDVDDIYSSPEEPGWIEWVQRPWRENDGAIKISFMQITGNPALSPSYRPWYERFAAKYRPPMTWEQFGSGGMLLGPEDAVATTRLELIILRSRDAGETWEDCSSEPPEEFMELLESTGGKDQEPLIVHEPISPKVLRFAHKYNSGLLNMPGAIIRCRDGRMVSTLSNRKNKKGALLGVRESLDDGKTWSDIQYISPEGSDPAIVNGASEENAMVELDNDRILVVVRGSRPFQTYLTRIGPGQYQATPPTWTPMPHSGNPELLRCSDGVIWYWGIQGHWYTADDGQTWRQATNQFKSYYGKMIETSPNHVLAVSQYLIHDSPYPYSLDSSVRQYRFSYRRSGILHQTDDEPSLAVASQSNSEHTDVHIRADVRVDGANGIAFRIQNGGRSYYVFSVILPGSEAYDLWFPPEIEARKLASPHAGEEEDRTMATGHPMCVLGRIDEGQLTVLRATKLLTETDEFSLGEVHPGDWLQMQVKVSGDLIQAAARKSKGQPATYVGARDASYSSGRVGLMTDRSTGAFKNVCVWDKALMIREMWE